MAFTLASQFLLLGIITLSSASGEIPLIERDEIIPWGGKNNDTLLFAHVLYRHGDSNIETTYPNDPFKNESYWPEGFGQLTKEGKRQHFELGQYFRRRYGKVIGDKYSAKKVYIQSTDVDRTIMSAQANLAGLFYPTEEEKWDDQIKWQPVPVHTVPTKSDYVLFVGKNCPKFNAAVKEYQNSSKEVQRIYTEYAELFTYWSKMSGSKIKTIDDVEKLYKALSVEHDHKLPLADWALKAIEKNGPMEYIASFYHQMYADTPQLARVESGFLLKEIVERFSQKINSTLQPDRSVWFYSAHSITLSFMLRSLGVFKPHIPPYASSIHFELYKNEFDQIYVEILYRSMNEEYPMPMYIPACDRKCLFSRFKGLYEYLMPHDFESECQLS